LANPRAMLEAYHQMQRERDSQQAETLAQIEQIDRLLAREREKRNRLLDLYAEGLITKDELQQKSDGYEQRVAALVDEHEGLAAQLKHVSITDEQLQAVDGFAREALPELERADFAVKRAIVEALDMRATLAFEDGQEVVYVHWCASNARLGIDIQPSRRL
jgi:multidrug resistance efflux pump